MADIETEESLDLDALSSEAWERRYISLTKLKQAIKKGLRESRGRVVLFSVKKKLIFTNSQSSLGMKIRMEFSTSSSQSKDHICCLYSRKEQYNVYCVKMYIHVPWRQGIVNGNQVYGAPYLT